MIADHLELAQPVFQKIMQQLELSIWIQIMFLISNISLHVRKNYKVEIRASKAFQVKIQQKTEEIAIALSECVV